MTDLRALLANATPDAPWLYVPNNGFPEEYYAEFDEVGPEDEKNGGVDARVLVFDNAALAALIVALVNAADELVAVTEAAREVAVSPEYLPGRVPLQAALAALDAKLAE